MGPPLKRHTASPSLSLCFFGSIASCGPADLSRPTTHFSSAISDCQLCCMKLEFEDRCVLFGIRSFQLSGYVLTSLHMRPLASNSYTHRLAVDKYRRSLRLKRTSPPSSGTSQHDLVVEATVLHKWSQRSDPIQPLTEARRSSNL
ncbi:hypothetical protein BDZ91DRAFT_504109 [Kalaharituber pfeilii]|nr:hypothetical protein BDZ91DRAFT_504109 [Kalaharituber pfeilii]